MPYKSDAQRRYFHAAGARGEIPMKTVNEFDTASKGMHLPEHVKMAHGGKVKPLAAMIVAKMHPGDEDGEEVDEGQIAAAEEMIEAIHERDAKKFAEGLCHFMDQYEAKPHEEYEHDGHEEHDSYGDEGEG